MWTDWFNLKVYLKRKLWWKENFAVLKWKNSQILHQINAQTMFWGGDFLINHRDTKKCLGPVFYISLDHLKPVIPCQIFVNIKIQLTLVHINLYNIFIYLGLKFTTNRCKDILADNTDNASNTKINTFKPKSTIPRFPADPEDCIRITVAPVCYTKRSVLHWS